MFPLTPALAGFACVLNFEYGDNYCVMRLDDGELVRWFEKGADDYFRYCRYSEDPGSMYPL